MLAPPMTAPRRRSRALVALLLAATACAAIAGCGNNASSGTAPGESATPVLDFTPNAVHSGIYLALERDYDGAQGVRLQVQVPSSSTDSVKLLLGGRAQFAILDIHDLAIAREKGRDVVGVMPLVERPLAAVLAQPAIRRPRDLEGRKAGVTGLPSDDAVLSSIVTGDGGDPKRVKRVTIGFQAVSALLARRVDAATGFWNVEGVALHDKKPATHQFLVDEYSAPPYPELVLCVARRTLDDDPALVRATTSTLERGYDEALNDPASAVQALVDQVPGTDRATIQQQFDAVQEAFVGDAPRFGALVPSTLRAWSRWEARFGITKRPPDVRRTFAFGYQ